MNFLRLILLALTLNLVAGTLLAQDSWTFRSPTPTGNRIVSYAYGNGLFVGVGGLGDIVTSPDGATWTQRESAVYDHLFRVTFGAGKFVAVGGTHIITSTDGVTWSRQTAPAALTDIVFGNGIYVAIAAPAIQDGNRRFLTSTDGANWTLRENIHDPVRVLFTNGTFVAPDTKGHVLTSANGNSWTAVTVDSSASSHPYFAAGNNRFLLSYSGRGVYLSTDGATWREVTARVPYQDSTVPVPNLSGLSSLGFAGGYFYVQQTRFAVDRERHYRSADGESWTLLPPQERFDFDTIAAGGGVSVVTEVIGYYSGFANNHNYRIHSSSDGLTWTSRSSELVTGIVASRPVYGLGRFFFAGKSSNDGIVWATTGFEPTHAAGNFAYRITTANNLTSVLASSDGLTSAEIDVKISQPRAVAFGANTYVMIGQTGQIASSSDGLTWTARTSGTTSHLNAIIHAFNRFIIVGDNSTLLTSTNGTTWTTLDPAPFANSDLKLLAASADRLLVHAISGGAIPNSTTLPGGIPVSFSTEKPFYSIAFFNGVFLGVAVPSSPYYLPVIPELWKSTDGSTWIRVPLRLAATSTQLTPAGTPLLVTGNGTVLLSSAVVSSYATSPSYVALLQATPTGVVAPPVISHPPASTTIHRGETAVFAVGATGSGPLSYQWFHDGVVIPGATAPALTLNLVTDADAGSYVVTITNSLGSATSTAATLTVLPPVPLVITQQPLPTEVANYAPAVLSVTVSGSGPITYQWRRNGQPILNATDRTFTITTSPQFYQYAVGHYDVVVTAPYSTVTSQSAQVAWGGLTTTVSPSGQVRVPVGSSVRVTASATGAHPPFTYQWAHQSGPDIPGATDATLTLTNVQGPRTESYAATISDSAGHHEYASFQLIVVPSGADHMTLTTQPLSQSAAPGDHVVLSISAAAGATYRYQWRRNLQPIAGATSSQLDLGTVTSATSGEYDVVVYENDYSAAIVSQPATLTVAGSDQVARLINLSARGVAGTGENTMILGFVVRDSLSKDLLLRAVGPGLTRFNLTGVLPDPHLHIVNSNRAVVAENNDWSTPISGAPGFPATSAAMSQLGAFPLTEGSRDSAVFLRAPSDGLYSALATSEDTTGGILLTEIYASSLSQRLVNLSARARVGRGDNLLIAGFVISGNRPMTVLLRAVGPSLADKGIAVPLVNPKLTLFDSTGVAIGNNDNWGQVADVTALRAATTACGAFALNEGSNDAAMLVTLKPGVYSIHVSSSDESSGVALAEIYEAP